MSQGDAPLMRNGQHDTPVSVPDDAWDDAAFSQRFQFQPYEPVQTSEVDSDEHDLPSPVSQPGFQQRTQRGVHMYDRVGFVGMIPVILLYIVHQLLIRWKGVLAVSCIGSLSAVFLFNVGRPEWRETAYYRVNPNVKVPRDAAGMPISVRPSHPIIPPHMNQCPGPHNISVPFSPLDAHPTPKSHPLAIVGDHQLVGLDPGQCITYRERYGMYTDEALNITYRLPEQLLPDSDRAFVYDDDPDNPLPIGKRPARIQSTEEVRARIGYDPLHGLQRDPAVSTSMWEAALRYNLTVANMRDDDDLFVPDWRALMDGCYRQRLEERGWNETAIEREMRARPFDPSRPALSRENAQMLYHTTPGTKRTVVVMRSYQGYPWREDDILNLRAMISELTLNNPNTPYDVRILVEVKDHSLSVFSSEWDRYRVLIESVPREFWGLVDFWSEKELEVLYAGLPGKFINNMVATTSYRSCLMALQKFWLDHQEYDFIYNWEMDVRYIGNYLDYFEGIEEYARREPLLPGMNKYDTWYIPNVTESEQNWRSEQEQNNFVGQEADMITLGPIFDPRGSGWYWTHDVQNYPKGRDTDRRASIGTNMRMSRALMEAMNVVNAEAKKSLHCEAWPTTLVLHSQMESSDSQSFYPTAGFTYTLPLPFKGVFAPHPIYFRHEWDVDELYKLLNRPNFYEKKNENLHKDSSFYYHAQHAKELYTGWKASEDGCRAPSMLHPIKRVDYVH
ncbi:hypothetical protein MVES1_001435 [Malassezia vespertilionis]|uniref:Uncharacterized protein n=1 Tax=Malassezia vespertilionis TaxID=2020962 RepID=A0A2N1JEW1_9BASI|nr:uncharacterized protein MVES1_001435 [Malassezia vespertilionis]PKI85097.1 hypothetical protein MVES_001353 [Malassezia vespertilionis]WFD06095.1 hypothetical protein MVES1_001435 [Malassezia vespertilionis]